MPTTPAQNMDSLDPDAQRMVAVAKADLIQQMGVTEEAIFVKSVEEKQWRNSSLGCPQPGMVYLQVITPGYRIVLIVGENDYDFHTDMSRAILCSPQKP